LLVIMSIVAILLAAGRAERFGGAKLHVPLADGPDAGLSIGVAACRRLAGAADVVIAVVRPGDDALVAALEHEGARVVVAHRADEGMGASLAAGVAAASDASGYVVALADMPWIESATISRVFQALANGASVVAPAYRGVRGHPVGFASTHRAALLKLRGDEGARAILTAHRDALLLIDVEDPGVVRDVDTPADLR
jgi:molybdenum cofactor cytidylyltransferase